MIRAAAGLQSGRTVTRTSLEKEERRNGVAFCPPGACGLLCRPGRAAPGLWALAAAAPAP